MPKSPERGPDIAAIQKAIKRSVPKNRPETAGASPELSRKEKKQLRREKFKPIEEARHAKEKAEKLAKIEAQSQADEASVQAIRSELGIVEKTDAAVEAPAAEVLQVAPEEPIAELPPPIPEEPVVEKALEFNPQAVLEETFFHQESGKLGEGNLAAARGNLRRRMGLPGSTKGEAIGKDFTTLEDVATTEVPQEIKKTWWEKTKDFFAGPSVETVAKLQEEAEATPDLGPISQEVVETF